MSLSVDMRLCFICHEPVARRFLGMHYYDTHRSDETKAREKATADAYFYDLYHSRVDAQ